LYLKRITDFFICQCVSPKIFLASSSELRADRKELEIFLNRKNKNWVKQGVFLELVLWEDFLDAISKTRLQDEYNRAIRECDLFILLFFTKVGKYTAEEFETAFGQFKATGKPFIFKYLKDAEISAGSFDEDDLMSLWAFKKKLKALGHFHTPYRSPTSRALIETGLAWSWVPRRVAASIRHPETNVLVARDGARIAGFGIMRYGAEEAHLELFAVDRDYRGHGLGRRLLEWLERPARVAGLARIVLEVRASNTGAQAFYERLGYRPLTRWPGYYQGREAALRMERSLR
jgi:ribosomal-protein-alanine acetyltransferase